MTKSIALRLFVAFFLLAILLFSFHVSVAAAQTPLEPLPAFDLAVDALPEPPCADLPAAGAAFLAQQKKTHAQMASYMGEVSKGYARWYRALQTLERRPLEPLEPRLGPMTVSLEVLAGASAKITELLESRVAHLAVWQTQVTACLGEAASPLIEKLDQFSEFNYEHVSSVSDFVGAMAGGLASVLETWQRDGKKQRFVPPEGYFTVLKTDGEKFGRAVTYVRDNSAVIEKKFAEFVSALPKPAALP